MDSAAEAIIKTPHISEPIIVSHTQCVQIEFFNHLPPSHLIVVTDFKYCKRLKTFILRCSLSYRSACVTNKALLRNRLKPSYATCIVRLGYKSKAFLCNKSSAPVKVVQLFQIVTLQTAFLCYRSNGRVMLQKLAVMPCCVTNQPFRKIIFSPSLSQRISGLSSSKALNT